MQVVFFSINFIIFVAGLVFLLKKPVSKYLLERKNSFLQGNEEAKKHYEDAFAKMNELNAKFGTLEKDGDMHVNDLVAQARNEGQVIVKAAETYAKVMASGAEDIIKEERGRTSAARLATFVRSVVANTKTSVQAEAEKKDYSGTYIKDYFSQTKELNSIS